MSAEFVAMFVAMREREEARAAARKSGVVLQFRLLAPASFVVLDLSSDPFAVSSDEHPEPGVELTLTVAAAHELLSGRLAPAQAAATGAVKARGGILRLLALQAFLGEARSAYAATFGA
ncbi:MAG: SCP2 sterol-binding domain-containing protein [Planctomycetia bacterium]|nr:SCP2 sterol-binding domain-containing protein [Planctomycetia bacterium]